MTMQPNESNQLSGWIGHDLVDNSGGRIGKIADLYMDDATGKPEWIAVSMGRRGSNIHFVPLAGAEASGDDLRVPYVLDQVKEAPGAKPDGHLSQDEEALLYRHYGMDYSENWSSSGLPAGGTWPAGGGAGGQGTTGRATGGQSTDDAMTRSEEELEVGTERREAGRVRLHKYVVTEQETRTVPVSHEEVRIEREPITDDNVDAALSGPEISEAEHEVVLHEEQPVVSKKVVPKERVRLDTETVADERQVSEEVHKERIDPEGDIDRDR